MTASIFFGELVKLCADLVRKSTRLLTKKKFHIAKKEEL